MLLNPGEDTRGELLETGHRDGGVEGLEKGIHDALKYAELDLVRHLVFALMRVVPVSFDNLFIIRLHDLQGHDVFAENGPFLFLLLLLFVQELNVIDSFLKNCGFAQLL